MNLIMIDQDKCRRDGLCAKECPAQVIEWAGKDDFPTPVPDAGEFCIRCGHCVAVCPHDAIKLEAIPLDSCPPMQREHLPGPEAIRHLLKSRRSIRQYKKVRVPHDLLMDLMDTARYAPTGSNKQQVHWTVVEDSSEVNGLAAMVVDFIRLTLPFSADEIMNRRMQRLIDAWEDGRDRIMRGAPHLILAHAEADLPFAEADCVIALTYLELYAFAKGMGTCWAGYFTAAAVMHEPLIRALRLPEGHRCFGAVMLGYPQVQYSRIPARNAAMVTWR